MHALRRTAFGCLPPVQESQSGRGPRLRRMWIQRGRPLVRSPGRQGRQGRDTRGDFEAAIRLAREALEFWPGQADAQAVGAKATQMLEQRKAIYRRIIEEINARRLVAAQNLLSEYRGVAAGTAELARFEAEIGTALEAARKLVERARGLEGHATVDEVASAYESALVQCRDLSDALDGLSRFPPEPPASVLATPTPLAIELCWKKSGPDSIISRVVRKAGSEPRSADDGVIIGEVSADVLVDAGAEPGVFYYYAVYSLRTGIQSDRPALAGPVFRVAEVEDLQVLRGDHARALSGRRLARRRASRFGERRAGCLSTAGTVSDSRLSRCARPRMRGS